MEQKNGKNTECETAVNYREVLYKDYDNFLGKYKEVNKDWKKYLVGKLLKKNILPHIPKDMSIKVVDIGCGAGLYLYSLKERGYLNVTGTDLNESNVNSCKENGIQCELLDGYQYLTRNPKSIDVIICSHIIEHLTKDECMNMIFAMKEALRDSGIIIISTPNLANPFLSSTSRYSCFTHEIGFTEISIKQVFLATGFSDVKVYEEKIFVINNPVFWIASLLQKITSFILFLFNCLYGNNRIKVFTRNLIAVVKK